MDTSLRVVIGIVAWGGRTDSDASVGSGVSIIEVRIVPWAFYNR